MPDGTAPDSACRESREWLQSKHQHSYNPLSTYQQQDQLSQNRVPTLLVTQISRTFPALSKTSEAFFQDHVVCQRCLNITTNSSYYGVRAEPRLPVIFFHIYTDKILANFPFRKFWHLHLHHCVRLPHHSLENSRTFQDRSLKFPVLSRIRAIFQDFPGPRNFTINPGLSRRRGNHSRRTTQHSETTENLVKLIPVLGYVTIDNNSHPYLQHRVSQTLHSCTRNGILKRLAYVMSP